jgi:branched-chain amino acid transport system substrate-binding protein
VVDLKYSGVDVFLNIATSRFGALAIRKAGELQWKPLHLVGSSNTSIKNTIGPAGFDHATGIISFAFLRDPSDPQTANDPDVRNYVEFVKNNMPGVDPLDSTAVGGYVTASLTAYILGKCGDDVTRANVLKQATTLKDPPIGMLREGVSIRTSPDNYLPYTAARLIRFDGMKWVTFGDPVRMKDE